MFRCFSVLLMMSSYLYFAGAGYISRPEQSPSMILVQTTGFQDQVHYEQCRYLRMDGLEAFMAEALATRYQDSDDKEMHHILSVISAIDAHSIVDYFIVNFDNFKAPKILGYFYRVIIIQQIVLSVCSPPGW